MKITRTAAAWMLLCTLLTGACTHSDKQSATAPSVTTIAESTIAADSMTSDTSDLAEEARRLETRRQAESAAEADTVALVCFNELTVRLSPMPVEDEDRSSVTQLQGDSAVFNAGLNDYTDDGLQIRMASDQLMDLTVAKRVEVALVVMNEDIACDIESTRRCTPWQPLHSNSAQAFVSVAYRASNAIKYLGLSLIQVRQLVRQYGDSAAYADVRSQHRLEAIASMVAIYAYHFRISGRQRDTGKRVTKHIIVYPRTGC